MHVVILSDTLPPDSPGGAGKIAWMLGQGLVAAGHQVTFITSTQGQPELKPGRDFQSMHCIPIMPIAGRPGMAYSIRKRSFP
jgi:hypothetical protein